MHTSADVAMTYTTKCESTVEENRVKTLSTFWHSSWQKGACQAHIWCRPSLGRELNSDTLPISVCGQ